MVLTRLVKRSTTDERMSPRAVGTRLLMSPTLTANILGPATIFLFSPRLFASSLLKQTSYFDALMKSHIVLILGKLLGTQSKLHTRGDVYCNAAGQIKHGHS